MCLLTCDNPACVHVCVCVIYAIMMIKLICGIIKNKFNVQYSSIDKDI